MPPSLSNWKLLYYTTQLDRYVIARETWHETARHYTTQLVTVTSWHKAALHITTRHNTTRCKTSRRETIRHDQGTKGKEGEDKESEVKREKFNVRDKTKWNEDKIDLQNNKYRQQILFKESFLLDSLIGEGAGESKTGQKYEVLDHSKPKTTKLKTQSTLSWADALGNNVIELSTYENYSHKKRGEEREERVI